MAGMNPMSFMMGPLNGLSMGAGLHMHSNNMNLAMMNNMNAFNSLAAMNNMNLVKNLSSAF